MADIKLFRVGTKVEELKSSAFDLEKKLQTLIERNMEKFFNVTFLASEYIIPEGRMDSVGIDENNAPGVAKGQPPLWSRKDGVETMAMPQRDDMIETSWSKYSLH